MKQWLSEKYPVLIMTAIFLLIMGLFGLKGVICYSLGIYVVLAVVMIDKKMKSPNQPIFSKPKQNE